MNTHFQSAAALIAVLTFPSLSWAENEVGFIERFALAADREKALGELVPGSEDYYFFHALHAQNTRNEAKLAEILKAWEERSPNENARRRIILNREALLDYDATPQQTLAYLKERLNVQHNHQQEARDKKPNLPVALDAARVAREVFLKDTLANDPGLQSLSVEAVESLVIAKTPLSQQQHRAALGKLTRPDLANLVEFIAAELQMKESSGFGQFAIHKALLPEQLDALAKLVPRLATEEAFVFTKLRKLAPGADVDIEQDAVEREAWLERVWAYAKTLPNAFNTVKAHILFRRLEHDRKKGIYDAGRFVEYLKLPRSSGFVNPKWLESVREKTGLWDVNADLSEPLLRARPIGNDEELVRDYFIHLFQTRAATLGDEKSALRMDEPYTQYVRDTWLKPVLAEALITAGYGKAENWASLLSPQAFQALKERVDIEFPRTNSEQFAPGDDVKFDVVVKNTPKLIVKIYELNALNAFQTQKRQLNTDLNLDGLVANSERTEAFDGGPFVRTTKAFSFPELKGRRGAWIVEFIGGGRSSRALLRVGQWQVVQTVSPGGDLLTVLDEKGEPVKDAVVWLDGRKLVPDEKLGSRIVVPFTAQPGQRPLIVSDPAGTFATLTQFEHHAEAHVLDAQFHIEREQLLARRSATLGVRVALMLGESHLAPEMLKDTKLTVTSTTHDGIKTTKEFKDLKLSAGSILTQEITVPERLATLTATLEGKVEVLSNGGEKRAVSASHSWQLNGMDKTDATNDGHLSKFGNDYVYELLGKNGEPIADQQIEFIFKHHGFTRTQSIALKTDEKGRVALGALAGIKSFHAKAPNGRDARWELDSFERTWAAAIHTGAGQGVVIPAPPNWAAGEVSLLETKAGTFVADHSAKLGAKDGFLVVQPLPPGDYSLRFRREERDIAIKISGGKASNGWYLGAARNLQAKAEMPLQIVNTATDAEFLTVKLANVTPFTRVHIAATRFEAGRGIFQGLGGFARFGAAEGVPARNPNLFSAGREIGDEYRYILDRRYAKLLPGNMLTRPGLLLNPWEVRDTDLNELAQQQGQQAGSTAGGRGGAMKKAQAEAAPMDPQGAPGGAAADTNLDFLANSAAVIFNLIPEADGSLKIPRARLGDRQHVQVYAEDLGNAVWRSFAVPEVVTKFSDLRLAKALDPAKPFTQRKEVTVLAKGEQLTLADILTSELETYDTLGGIHSLFTTLSGNGHLAQFAWLLNWPRLKDDEKRAKYSEFACHELHFFLSRKDPVFFDAVVKPYLANKKDRTFMDDFLLGADMARYLEPTAFAQLNAVERALLATRIKANAADISRSLREQWELLPPNPAEQDRLFETALRGREMEETVEALAALGVDKADASGAVTSSRFRMEKSKAMADDLRSSLATPAPAAPMSPAPAMAAKPTSGNRGLERATLARLADGGIAMDAKQMDRLADMDGDGSELQELRKSWQVEEKARSAARRQVALGGMLLGEAEGLGREKRPGEPNVELAFFGVNGAAAVTANYRAMFRPLGATKEWAENNYYKLRIVEQNAALVPVNAFWRDYAAHVAAGKATPFVSANVAEASGNFTEMMLALAVLDLPFDAPEHASKTDAGKFSLTAGGPVVVYHKEIKPAGAAAADAGQLLVSQSFFRANDRFRQEGNEKFEKYVTEEFLTGAVYGANVVVTNPTSSPSKAEVLLQIPQGALPVSGSKATDSRRVQLAPYTTQTFEYYFYFPATAAEGKKFPHFPVNAAVKNTVAGAAKPFEFNVVAKLTQFDKASWDYVSQYGTDAEVFAFLEQNNLASLAMPRIAWRCKDAAFFKKLTAFLGAHHIWDETIFSYALVHNDGPALREWLKHKDAFVSQCGPFLSTKLVLLDPIERRAYEQLEYSPLVNQRAHKLGNDFRIANPAVRGQYTRFLDILAHKPALDPMDTMTVSYHLFLQDRVEEALARFSSVDPNAVVKETQHDNFGPAGAGNIVIEKRTLPTQIQHDYFRCYADFYEGNLADARTVAAKYAAFPVTRWRTLFSEVTSQLDEIEGKAPAGKGDKPDREKQQAELAATEPTFDFKVEKQTISMNYKNLGDVTVNYYLMDPEFSFSSNPFVSEDASRFSIIKPNKSAVQALAKDKDALDIPLPAEFAKANVLIEIVGAGQRKAQAYHANTLKLTLTENYGRLETRDSTNDKAVAKAYVKVYARLKNGTVRFYKDGYTDLRGRFDYASLNGGGQQAQPMAAESAPKNGLDYQMLKPAELASVEKLSILILSETNGATTREVKPPGE